MWPGVSQLPDYALTFPKWKPRALEHFFPDLSEQGLDFLQVSLTRILVLFIFNILFSNFYDMILLDVYLLKMRYLIPILMIWIKLAFNQYAICTHF